MAEGALLKKPIWDIRVSCFNGDVNSQRIIFFIAANLTIRFKLDQF